MATVEQVVDLVRLILRKHIFDSYSVLLLKAILGDSKKDAIRAPRDSYMTLRYRAPM